ncbi:MAG: glycosyltransferase family 2 protein [Bacteroidetes bacterium]|nr:glycosyltransferase family 2 protein [Bacteroidota bacterium]
MDITVLIITRKRSNLLKRAIASIKSQCFGGTIKILVFVDDCVETLKFLEQEYYADEKISWHFQSRGAEEKSGPARSAYLRNLAVESANSEWVSFLDDDNEFEPFHYSELMRCALINKADAVYCYRQLFYADGTPYCFINGVYPWARNSLQAKEQFERLSKHGIIEKGCNVIRDQIDASEGGVNLVDTNVWLIKREVLLKNKIPDDFTHEDWLNIICEDDKMLQCLIDTNVKIFCNQVPSVKYYLGGYSNVNYVNSITKQNVYSEEWEDEKDLT